MLAGASAHIGWVPQRRSAVNFSLIILLSTWRGAVHPLWFGGLFSENSISWKIGRKKLHISVELCVGITWLPGKCNVLSCRCDSPVDCRRHPLSYEETVSIRIRSRLCWHYLSSRQVTLQVLSAQMSLTSVFGMGTGGPSSQSIPTRMDGFETIVYVKYPKVSNHFFR